MDITNKPATRTYTRQIADFAATFRLKDVPADVVARAKWLMLDGLGCGLHGAHLEWTRILAGVVGKLEPGGGQATIWGRGESSSAVNAALVNGTMVQGYELDDGNPAGSFHSCAVVLPAAIAAAEYRGARNVSGERLLTALIAGFEIGPRVSICMGGEHMIKQGWHAPAVVSAFPAAVSAGIVLGLSADQFFHALGIAGTQASGLMAAQYGSMVKRMQCAKNAQSGLYAALLAADGFTGIENIFEEKFGGYCTTFSGTEDAFDLSALVTDLGKRWETMRIGMKIYAAAGGIHTAISAIEDLMSGHALRAAHVDEITIGVTEARVRHHGWSPYVPNSLTTAQFHYGFCVALQLIEGKVFVDEMVEKNIARPDLVDLANRVHVVRSVEREQMGNDYRKGCDVEVKLKSGGVLHKTVDFSPGNEHRPLSEAQIQAKFRRLASEALSRDEILALEAAVRSLDTAPSAQSLVQALRSKRPVRG